jgi:hypothetical protein
MYSSIVILVTRIGGGASRSFFRSITSSGLLCRSTFGISLGVSPLNNANRMLPLNGDVQSDNRSLWLLINAFSGYSTMAWTPVRKAPATA